MNGKILIVDDDELIRHSLFEVLRMVGYEAMNVENGIEALDLLERQQFDIVITDLKMPGLDGIGLLKRIKETYSNVDVIIATSYGTVESAVEAMKYGASDYILKPIIDEEIKMVIKELLSKKEIKRENEYLRRELTGKRDHFDNIIGNDPKMQRLYSVVDSVANTKATVLINGESGTGKGLIAQAICHADVVRRDKPFVEVSCGALPATLLESELFGHVKGAFTSAIKDRMGRFELANGGTIFLDEIDSLSPLLQVKLLRVLQDMEFERVGDTRTMKVDVRIIAATNQNLDDLIKKGMFREDLYYRLNVIKINLPPLRDRKGDIPLLCKHFVEQFNKKFDKKIEGLDDDFMRAVMLYNWPGNIRELENTMERAVVLCKTEKIILTDLPETILDFASKGQDAANSQAAQFQSLKDALREPEKRIIEEVLNVTGWNRQEAAKILDINRTTLYNKMRDYNLIMK